MPWPLEVAEPPSKSKMGVAETTPKSLEATPVWPGGGFGHPHKANFLFFFFFLNFYLNRLGFDTWGWFTLMGHRCGSTTPRPNDSGLATPRLLRVVLATLILLFWVAELLPDWAWGWLKPHLRVDFYFFNC